MSNLVSFSSQGDRSIGPGTMLLVAFFCFLGFGVMLGGILAVYRYQKATSTYTETLATITESSGSFDSYVLTLQFVEKNTGNQITAKCSTDDSSIAQRRQVSILYDSTNPTNVELKATYEGYYLLNALMVTFGGAIIAVPTTTVIIAYFTKRRIHKDNNSFDSIPIKK